MTQFPLVMALRVGKFFSNNILSVEVVAVASFFLSFFFLSGRDKGQSQDQIEWVSYQWSGISSCIFLKWVVMIYSSSWVTNWWFCVILAAQG